MLDLRGLSPSGFRHSEGKLSLIWPMDEGQVETGFDRFLPVGVYLAENSFELDITWRDFSDLELDDPFFPATVKRAIDSPIASKQFRTFGEPLSLIANSGDLLPFSGAIFHTARTGSTLIHRLLSQCPSVLSISEITNIDRVAYITARWPQAERKLALQNFVSVFRRRRRSAQQYFVTKMTDVSANRIGIFRRAFPDVPWIFVYRDPVEVLASVIAQPTGNVEDWFKNRTATSRRLMMPRLNDPGMWPVEFVARTLGNFCKEAVRAARATEPGKFLAVNYSRLPDAIWETIAPHFGIPLTEVDRAAMVEEARYYAKNKNKVEFQPDLEAKRAKVTPQMRKLSEQFIEPAMNELKALPQG